MRSFFSRPAKASIPNGHELSRSAAMPSGRDMDARSSRRSDHSAGCKAGSVPGRPGREVRCDRRRLHRDGAPDAHGGDGSCTGLGPFGRATTLTVLPGSIELARFDQRGNGATMRDRGLCDHEDPQAGSPPTLRPRRTVLGAFALLREYLAAKGDAVAADRDSGTR